MPTKPQAEIPVESMPGETRAAPAGSRSPSARWALVSLALSMLMPSLDTSIANAGLPSLARAFDASFAGVQWIVLAYLLAITASIVSVGRLGDVLGRRRLLLAGIALFTAASLLCGLAPTLGLLVAARAVQGLGAALLMALSVALVGEAVPRERTGRAMGLLGTMSALGTTLGPALGGLLTSALGWRTIFLVNVPVGVVVHALARRHLAVDRRRTERARGAFDLPGTLLLALTLAAYALAMTLGREAFGAWPIALLAAAALGAWAFVRVERRSAAPLIRPALFREPALSASLAAGALVATVVMASLVVGPFYLARALGLPPPLVGLALSVGPLVAALCGVPAGRLVDRAGARRALLAGLLGLAAGCLLLAWIPERFGLAGYLAPLAVVTASYALFQAANNTGLLAGTRDEQRGVVAGLLSLSRNLGLVTGTCVMGAVFALATASDDVTSAPPAAVAVGMRSTFAVASLLIVGALALALRGGRAAAPLSAPPGSTGTARRAGTAPVRRAPRRR